VYIDIANEYQNNSLFPEAVRYLKKAIRANPSNDMAYLELLFCCQVCDVEEKESVLQFLDRLINKDPYNHLAWAYYGVLCLELKETEKALEAFDFSITANEDYMEAYMHKGETLMDLERYEEALEVYKELLHKGENMAGVYFSLGECYEQMKQFESALHYYQLAIKKEPSYSDAYMSIGVVLDQMGRSHEALGYLESAFKHDDSNLEAILYYADIKKELGIYPDALEVYGFLEAFDVTWKDYWINYSDTFFLSGKTEEAIEIIYNGLKHHPDDAEFYYRWAGYLLCSGKANYGGEILSEAYEKNPEGLPLFLEIFPDLVFHPAVINL
jgi:tetratricopeptide (TPR) repeat protein